MKNFKKFTAAIAATLMAATMVAPMALNAFAAGETAIKNVEFTLDATGFDSVTADAYKIFNITKEGSGYVTNDEAWTPAAMQAAVVGALNVALGYTGDNAGDAISSLTPSEALKEISALASNAKGTGTADVFARELAKAIGAGSFDAAKTPLTEKDGKFVFGSAEDAVAPADGYYIVLATATKKNSEDGSVADETTKSLGMLTVVNGETEKIGKDGNAKVALPSVEKKVLEDDNEAEDDYATYEQDDAKWNDNADLQIGQTATFGLYGTLPSNYDMYDSYYYKFNDTLNKVFERPTNFTVETEDGTVLSQITGEGPEATGDYKIVVNGDGITSDWTISIEFPNLKTNAGITEDTVIIVKYDTALTDAAVAGAPNENKVNLTYSNNPNNGGNGETSTTPDDKTAVYTYDFKFEKTFWNGTSPLTPEEIVNGTYKDLKFHIGTHKFKKVTPTTDSPYDYILIDDDDTTTTPTTTDLKLTLIDDEGNVVKVDENGKPYKTNGESPEDYYTKEEVEGFKLVVRIKGLDSDEYTITEETPTDFAYKAIEEAEFELQSELTYVQDRASFESVDYEWSSDDYTADGDGWLEIKNNQGSTLPSTGGIGTTLFYLGGGAMVAVAGVFLITKKRMGKDEA